MFIATLASLMPYEDPISPHAFTLQRNSPFSYQCGACSRCCHGKAIRIDPYEILRLARRLGLSTTDFIATHTEAGGTVLRIVGDEATCRFLGPDGCSVHADRPLVCRLYPLGVRIDSEGVEKFGLLPPHPQTKGRYGFDAVIADYLNAQGVAPYEAVGARYKAVYDKMVDRLESLDAEELERREQRRSDVDATATGAIASPWIDIDQSVAVFCASKGLEPPTDVDSLISMHLAALDAWIDSL